MSAATEYVFMVIAGDSVAVTDARNANEAVRRVQAESEIFANVEIVRRVTALDMTHLFKVIESEVGKRLAAEAELKSERPWVPVTEQMPAVGEHVLVAGRDGGAIMSLHADAYGRPDGWACEGEKVALADVSHWRHLPLGPEVKR